MSQKSHIHISPKFGGGAITYPSFLLFLEVLSPFTITAVAQRPPAAQPQTPTNPSPSQQSQPADKSEEDQDQNCQKQSTGTSKDRLFFALPNFLTLETRQGPPLTTGQKFKVVTRSAFDYVEYPWYAFLAGISQAENSEPGYGQGVAGYGKRYGAAFADGTIESFVTGAILPSVLRQDARYFQLGQGSFWHRTGYSISRIVVTHTDSGHNQFNFSEIIGSAIATTQGRIGIYGTP